MRLSAPSTGVFVIAAVVAVLAVIVQLGYASIPVIGEHRFWSMTAAFALLSLGCLLKRF